MAKQYRFIGHLHAGDRFDRYEASESKTLELNGEPVTLTDSQFERATQFIQIQEVPEGVTVADYGPSIEEQQQAAESEASPAPAAGRSSSPRTPSGGSS